MKYLYIVLCALLLSSAVAVPVTSAQQACSPTTPAGDTEFVIVNTTNANAHIFWIDYGCVETAYGTIAPGEAVIQPSILGHLWVIRDDAGGELVNITATQGVDTIFLDGTVFNPEPISNSCSANKSTNMINLIVNNLAPAEKVLFSWIDDVTCREFPIRIVEAQETYLHQNSYVGAEFTLRHLDGRAIQNIELSQAERFLIYDPSQASAVTLTPTAQPTQQPQPEKPTQEPVTTQPEKPTEQPQTTKPEQPTQSTPQSLASSCEVLSVTPDMGYEPYYAKYCDYNGLIITGSDQVADASLKRVADILSNMFVSRPDIVESLVNSNFRLVVIAEHETVHGVPELAYLLDQEGYLGTDRIFSKIFDEPRIGVAPEENLLCAFTDIDYGQINFVKTLANLTRYELITNLGFDGNLVNTAREQAIAEGIWNGDWVTETNGNYWDYGVQAYFNSAYDALLTGPIDDYTNTREELASYDPRLYALIDSVYQAPEWTPNCDFEEEEVAPEEVAVEEQEPATIETEQLETTVEEVAPAEEVISALSCEVLSVTPDMGYEPYYAKYCDYNGLIITGSDQVADASLERVADILSNMFGARPDIVESLVNSNFRLVVIAEHETVHGVPELAYLLDQEGYVGTDRIFSKIFDEPRIGVAPEENLLCAFTDIDYGQINFIKTLANLTRYELITNLGFDGSLVNTAREQAIAEGIWNGDWVTETNGNYWDYGVQAYFNSAYDALLTGPIDDYTNTREELASYDPRLYALIDSVYQAPEWTPACP